MSKVNFNFSKKINLKEKEEKGVPLVVTYHPSLRGNLYLLYMNDKVKKVFSFRNQRKLSSYIVRAKLYSVENSYSGRTVGSFKCTKKHSKVCKDVNKTDSFTSLVT